MLATKSSWFQIIWEPRGTHLWVPQTPILQIWLFHSSPCPEAGVAPLTGQDLPAELKVSMVSSRVGLGDVLNHACHRALGLVCGDLAVWQSSKAFCWGMAHGAGGMGGGTVSGKKFLQNYQKRKHPPVAQHDTPQPLKREGLTGASLKCDPFLLAVSPWKEAEMPLGCMGITYSEQHESMWAWVVWIFAFVNICFHHIVLFIEDT